VPATSRSLGGFVAPTPNNVRQVIAFSQFPRSGGLRPSPDGGLRPIERRVLRRWRDGGADFADLAARFRRRTGFLEQVEQQTRYKLAR
jgi:hypothetical protein